MKKIQVVIVIPVGPNCEFKYIIDTIESIKYYITSSKAIILIDDSGKKTGSAIKVHHNDITILTTPKHYGRDTGLYLSLSQGFSFAYENYDFDVILRLDTDALIIGPNPENDATYYFNQKPDVGIIGSYRTDCNGDPRLFSKAAELLHEEMSLKGLMVNKRDLLSNPLSRLKGVLLLRELYQKSLMNGYEPGEHCMGGAYFISRLCVEKLYTNKLLSRHEISWSLLQEDMIFGLLINSIGMKHGDFATGTFPMGLRWRGLPCSPEDLIKKQKKVIHSTRYFNDLSEQNLREYFRTQRHF